MRKKIENTSTIFFISALYLLAYSTEGNPTTEPRKALNPQAITANIQLCHVEEIGNSETLSLDVNETTLTRPGLYGVCLSNCLSPPEKTACRMKDSSKTECVNESSTAALCQNSKF